MLVNKTADESAKFMNYTVVHFSDHPLTVNIRPFTEKNNTSVKHGSVLAHLCSSQHSPCQPTDINIVLSH